MRNTEQASIKITGMDANRTYKFEGAIYHVYLTLSASPSADWIDDFNRSWRDHFYMMKRHAQVEGAYIRVDCPLVEIETGLKSELGKIIQEVNAREAERISRAEKARTEQEVREKEERAMIEATAKRVNDLE
ncbi:hypothetical protein [Pseudaestuariivita atlantica]|uniref:Uncharacterized protein n=1 Tax=Pseudaestuariivita atlantica TaxID=1317121 RepID=A0A0L1JLN4_9RHOB|nr:hypothetical protein [Pseudaestuariivita atlantica]KNG92664.1 hypothetical protein ATO11_16775 [Pseudaestuariivita atlantica]